MLIIERLVRLYPGLDRGHGAYATERAKRKMIAQKQGGRMPGERSINRAERREARRENSRIRRKRYYPGQRVPGMPGAGVTSHGVTVVWLISRQQARREARQKRREEQRQAAGRVAPPVRKLAAGERVPAATPSEERLYIAPPLTLVRVDYEQGRRNAAAAAAILENLRGPPRGKK